ncbi:MAG: hypothetical protein ACRDTJ_07520 [Pseudonocardiaceae bacterium]
MRAVTMPAHDHDRAPNQGRNPGPGRDGRRVLVPTIEGDRRTPTYATLIGPDPDSPGFVLVHTDRPVMGERLHSIETADITDVTEGNG